jgi:hypothetical protein
MKKARVKKEWKNDRHREAERKIQRGWIDRVGAGRGRRRV